jgi:hypothetical protein
MAWYLVKHKGAFTFTFTLMGQCRLGEIQQPHGLSRGTRPNSCLTQAGQPFERVALV